MPIIHRILYAIIVCIALEGCYPPPVQYATTKLVTERRNTLYENLLKLLPAKQQKLKAAQGEARWLADTSYKAAAGVARVNGSHFPGWAGNALVNTRLQDRGLCWHYQHDMYRELRRRPLRYFRLGCCVRDEYKRTEHNCLYIAAAGAEWPQAWVLDAWMWNGRLKVNYAPSLSAKRWQDLPSVCNMLAQFYVEGHKEPIEHWLVVRGSNGKYNHYRAPGVVNSAQSRRMYTNILKGRREHPGSPTNY